MRGILTWVLLPALVAFISIGACLDRYGQRERAQPAQAIVVLGSKIEADGQPGDSLRARTLHTVALYQQQLASAIIFTGGQGSDEPRPESESAREVAIEEGVPADHIYTETLSTNTRENAHYAADICRAHGWRTVIVVSDPYHLWRGQRNLQQEGLTVYPSPALNCQRNQNLALRLLWTARETLAVIRDVASGH